LLQPVARLPKLPRDTQALTSRSTVQEFAIEVKFGRKKSAQGLTAFCARQPEAVPIIVTPENFAAFSRDTWAFLMQAGGLST
jgi:hypothetical protein